MEEVQEVSLEWRGRGSEVLVAGEFSNWVGLSMVKQADELWNMKLKVKHGEYMYKFIVDGEWKTSDEMKTSRDVDGNTNNLLVAERMQLPWQNGFKDTSENISEDINELLEDRIDDAYLPSAPTIEFTAPSLESEVDKVTDYLNEINQNKEEVSEITLKWKGPGKKVLVAGSFSNWEGLSMANEEKDLWKIKLKMRNGQHLLNYIVDGKTVLSDYIEKASGPNNEVFNLLNITPEHEFNDIESDVHADNDLNVDDDEEVSDVTIIWKGHAKDVLVSGDFSNWIGLTMTKVEGNTWSIESKLKHGQYLLMFFVDGEVVLSDSLEQVTGDDDEVYNLLVVESEKAPTYKKYSTYDNIADCVTKPINDEVVTKPDSLDLEISDNIMHGNRFSDSVTVTENSNGKKLYKECDTDACEPFIGTTGFLKVKLDGEDKEISQTDLTWKGRAKNVKVAGEFSNWVGLTMSNVEGELWKTCLKLKPGNYDLQFIIDEDFDAEVEKSITGDFETNIENDLGNAENDSDMFLPEAETSDNTIFWTGHAKDVQVVGEFSDWAGLTMSKQNEDTWSVTLKQKRGSYLLKFIVDGKYMLSEYLQKVIGPDQEVYNLLDVNANDDDETDSETDSIIITDDEKLYEQNIFNPFDDNFADDLKDARYNPFAADINEELSIIYEEDSSLKIEKEDIKLTNFEIPRDLIQPQDNVNKDTIGEVINIEDAFQMSGNTNLVANNIFDASNTMVEVTNEKQIDINNDRQVAELETNNDLLSPYKSSPYKPSKNDEVAETDISWKGFADDVKVVGDFSNWEGLTMSNLREDIWKINLKLKTGQHLFKFIVDEKYMLSKFVDKVIGPDEEIYNVIEVYPEDRIEIRLTEDSDNGYIGMEDLEENFSNKIMNHNQKISLNPFMDSMTLSRTDSGYEPSFEDHKQELSSDEEHSESVETPMVSPEVPEHVDEQSDINSLNVGTNVKTNIFVENTYNQPDNLYIVEAVKISGSILRVTDTVFDTTGLNVEMADTPSTDQTKPNTEEDNTIPMIRQDQQMNVFLGSQTQKGENKEDQPFTLEDIQDILNDTHNEVAETSIHWYGYADDVKVLGEFSNWEALTMSIENENKWNLTIKQKTGQFLLKFIVDGKYMLSEHLEKVIGSDQELYNLLDVLPDTNAGAQNDNTVSKFVNENQSNQSNAALEVNHVPLSEKLMMNDMVQDEQNINQEMEMDAVETLEKTLGVTNYVIQSNTIKTEEESNKSEEPMIPLIRSTEDQLSVFLASMVSHIVTQSMTAEQEPEPLEHSLEIETEANEHGNKEQSIPLIRNTDEQLSVFLATNKQAIIDQQENDVQGMSLAAKQDHMIPLIRKADDQLSVFLGNTDHSQVVEKRSVPIIQSSEQHMQLLDSNSSEGVFEQENIITVNNDIMSVGINKENTLKEKLKKEKLIEGDIIEAEELLSNSNVSITSPDEDKAQEEQMKKEQAQQEQIEEEKSKQEIIKRERMEEERMEKDRIEQERIEKERIEHEKFEKEIIENERIEKERLENERIKNERIEKEKVEKERIENERIKQERIEDARIEQENMEKERIEQERIEQERIEQERVEQERIEMERIEKERIENERLEKKRIEKERIEQERIEKERIEKERIENEIIEKERIENERIEKERIEKENIEKDRIENEIIEQERIERERIDNERIEKERIEKEKAQIEKERLEEERIKKEKAEQERIEQERIEQDRIEKERIKKEKAEQERIEQERIERERLEQERIEQERIEKEKAEQERIEQEIIEKERIEKERIEKERIEKERIEKERIEDERIGKERIERERIEKETIEKERIEKERIEKERIEEERIEKERIEKEKLEKERIEKERIEKERIEQERIEKEKLEKERIEKERIEKERIEKERIEKERIEKERIEKERIEKERIEKERIEEERIKQEIMEQERVEQEKIEQERSEKERIEKEKVEKEKIEKEKIVQERIEKQRIEDEKIERQKIEQERIEKEILVKERIEKERLEEEERVENERIAQGKIAEKERKDQERLAEQKKRIELEIEAEEERIENERKVKEDELRLQEARQEEEIRKIVEEQNLEEKKKLEAETILLKQAEERAIVEDIRIQMLIDKNNKLLLDEQEREEKEKARLAREAEERAQVEEQIRKEEVKLEMLRIEKENEEQNRKKEQDMKRINDFIEKNNQSKSIAEKQMTADDGGVENDTKEIGYGMNAKVNAAFVANEINHTVEIATPTNVANGNDKINHTLEPEAEQNKEKDNGQADNQNATKVAIEQAKNAAEATVANIEEILMKKEETKEVSNGTFVSLEVESSETSLDCRKKNPVMRKMLKLCQCNIL